MTLLLIVCKVSLTLQLSIRRHDGVIRDLEVISVAFRSLRLRTTKRPKSELQYQLACVLVHFESSKWKRETKKRKAQNKRNCCLLACEWRRFKLSNSAVWGLFCGAISLVQPLAAAGRGTEVLSGRAQISRLWLMNFWGYLVDCWLAVGFYLRVEAEKRDEQGHKVHNKSKSQK